MEWPGAPPRCSSPCSRSLRPIPKHSRPCQTARIGLVQNFPPVRSAQTRPGSRQSHVRWPASPPFSPLLPRNYPLWAAAAKRHPKDMLIVPPPDSIPHPSAIGSSCPAASFPSFRSFSVSHWQKPFASFQLTPHTGCVGPCSNPGAFHVLPPCFASLSTEAMPPVASYPVALTKASKSCTLSPKRRTAPLSPVPARRAFQGCRSTGSPSLRWPESRDGPQIPGLAAATFQAMCSPCLQSDAWPHTMRRRRPRAMRPLFRSQGVPASFCSPLVHPRQPATAPPKRHPGWNRLLETLPPPNSRPSPSG